MITKSGRKASGTGFTENSSFFPKKGGKIKTETKNPNDTIAAPATPHGRGGIGVIRISGQIAAEIAGKIFVPAKKSTKEVFRIEDRRIVYGKIIDPENREIVDEVILCPMLAPHSYTREDVVEIQTHSGPAVVEKVMDLVLSHGARIAEPGEFTKRAFLNGRIDLTQAEAVVDLIKARNESARKIAATQLTGGLKKKLSDVKTRMIEALARIEAEIDFFEDMDDPGEVEESWRTHILTPLEKLQRSAEDGLILKDGVNIVLAGKPNVGKSSLMNRMLNQERAIVTSFPGTTRDHIEEGFELNGVWVRLFDTAGLHETSDLIETIGIQKTREVLEKAHLVLFVCDMSNKMETEDFAIYDSIREKEKIVVLNKKDLFHEKNGFKVPEEWKGEKIHEISALYGDGVEELKRVVADNHLNFDQNEGREIFISNARQKGHVKNALEAVRRAMENHDAAYDPRIASIEFKDAVKEMDAALGIEIGEDVLDTIFKQFCIGK